MSELRLILIAAGVVLIVGIYIYSRRADRNKNDTVSTVRREPVLPPAEKDAAPGGQPGDSSAPDAADKQYQQSELPLPEELRPDPVTPAQSSARSPGGDKPGEKVIVMHVAAKAGQRFAGPAIVEALRAENLVFGDYGIFHRRASGQSLFHVANMVEPGQFDLDNIETFSSPGLSLFLVLPGPNSPIAAFTEMLSTARRLAANLGGEVLDEKGSTLSRQAASHLREQIIEFAHRLR